ncbi:MAG: hypothetical protein QM749_19695 [Aquabacterium sp.]
MPDLGIAEDVGESKVQDIDLELVFKLRSQLVIHDEFEARYWARVLGLTRAQVRKVFGEPQAPQATEDGFLARDARGPATTR